MFSHLAELNTMNTLIAVVMVALFRMNVLERVWPHLRRPACLAYAGRSLVQIKGHLLGVGGRGCGGGLGSYVRPSLRDHAAVSYGAWRGGGGAFAPHCVTAQLYPMMIFF